MKKAIVISTLIATTFTNSGFVKASSNKEQDIGVVSGAITGAAIGGPLGLIIGTVVGGLIGESVNTKDQLQKTQLKLSDSNNIEKKLKHDLRLIEKKVALQESDFSKSKEFDILTITKGLTVNLMFTTNSSELAVNDYANIKQLSTTLLKFPQLNLKLDGFADPRGSELFNMELAEQRIKAVKEAFESFGVDSNRVISIAHGEISSYGLNKHAMNKDIRNKTNNRDKYAMARKVSINFVEQPNKHVAEN